MNRREFDPLRSLMEAQPAQAVRMGIACVAAAAFYFAFPQGLFVGPLCVLLLLWAAEKETRNQPLMLYLAAGLFLTMGVAAHLSMLTIRSARMSRTLLPLLEDMWNYDLNTAMAWEENSWSGGYLVLLGLISRLEENQVTVIKLVNLCFTTGSALAVGQLARQRGASCLGRVGAMGAAMLLPTVLLNSGCWGQCDAIFACFALWGLSLLLDRHPCWGCLLLGMAGAFKLQGMFMYPLLLPMFMEKKVSLRHLLLGVAGFAAFHVPMLVDGQALMSILARYNTQIIDAAYGTVGLTDNGPGIYGLMNIASVREFSGMGMFLSFACALLFALALTKRGPITDRGYVSAALVLCIGLPLVLPQMNARGLYLAGLLSLTLVQDWKGALVALVLETVSLCGYMAAIFNNTILPLTVLSLMGIGLMLAAVVLFLDETQKVPAHGQD